ncbi:MAG: hypothetical protein AAF184_21355 [Pseudomonadota bacterium]
MKKIALMAALLLSAAGANAQTLCVDFVNFCDGFEINITQGVGVEGTWKNYDCAGSDSAMNVTRNRGDGNWLSACSAQAGCDVALALGRDAWVWLFNFATATGDLIAIDAGIPTFLQDDTPIAITQGACTLNPGIVGPSNSSAAQ